MNKILDELIRNQIDDSSTNAVISEMIKIQRNIGWGMGAQYATVDMLSQLITNNILPVSFRVEIRYLYKIIITLYMLLRAPSVFEAQSNMERLLENLTVFTASPARVLINPEAPGAKNSLSCGLDNFDIFHPGPPGYGHERYIMNNASRNTTFSSMAPGTIGYDTVHHQYPKQMNQFHLNTIYEAQDPQSGSYFNTPSIPISTEPPESIEFNMIFSSSVGGIQLYQHGNGIDLDNMHDICQIQFKGTQRQSRIFDLTAKARELRLVSWHQFSKAKCAQLLNSTLQDWVRNVVGYSAEEPPAQRYVDDEYLILQIIGEIFGMGARYEQSLQKLMHDIVTVVLIKTKGDLFQLASSIHPQLATNVYHHRLDPGRHGAVEYTNICNALLSDKIQNPFDSDPKYVSSSLRAMLHNDNSATLLNIELSEAIIRGELERIRRFVPQATSGIYNRQSALESLISVGKMCRHYIIASTVSSSLANSVAGSYICPNGGCTNSYYNQKATECADKGTANLCATIGVNQGNPTGMTFAFNKSNHKTTRKKATVKSRNPSRRISHETRQDVISQLLSVAYQDAKARSQDVISQLLSVGYQDAKARSQDAKARSQMLSQDIRSQMLSQDVRSQMLSQDVRSQMLTQRCKKHQRKSRSSRYRMVP